MKLRKTLITIGVIFLLLSCNKEEAAVMLLQAGYQKAVVNSPDGGNTPVAIWYPTTEGQSSYDYNTAASDLNVTGLVAENGVVADGKWPLIIFSHGFSGGGVGSVEICEALAREGYVVVAPDHSDPVIAVRIDGPASGTLTEALEYLENNPFGDGTDYEYRIPEILGIADYFSSDRSFNIDQDQLVLAGHSMGGWTVMKAVEARLRPAAMFLFSMGELNWLFAGQRYFEAPFFQALDFPTAYFYGGVEYAQAIDFGRNNVYAAFCFTNSPGPSYGLLVPEGNHFTYNSRAIAPQSYGTVTQLESINSRLINFLDKHLNNSNVEVASGESDVSK
jgi:pimeloyl-ACP methyl ester carboxylesterase